MAVDLMNTLLFSDLRRREQEQARQEMQQRELANIMARCSDKLEQTRRQGEREQMQQGQDLGAMARQIGEEVPHGLPGMTQGYAARGYLGEWARKQQAQQQDQEEMLSKILKELGKLGVAGTYAGAKRYASDRSLEGRKYAADKAYRGALARARATSKGSDSDARRQVVGEMQFLVNLSQKKLAELQRARAKGFGDDAGEAAAKADLMSALESYTMAVGEAYGQDSPQAKQAMNMVRQAREQRLRGLEEPQPSAARSLDLGMVGEDEGGGVMDWFSGLFSGDDEDDPLVQDINIEDLNEQLEPALRR
jgi:hypothetical protein